MNEASAHAETTSRKSSNGNPGGQPREKANPGDQGSSQEVASELAVDAKQIATSQISKRTTRYADELGSVAKALRVTGAQLDAGVAATYVNKAAGQLERASRFIEEARPEEVLQAVENFARREPWLFLGGALATGLVAARFVKSSAHHFTATTATRK